MAGPVAEFGFQLWSTLWQLGLLAGRGGTFISPLSIYIALVLALNGADLDSPTHAELWTVLKGTLQPDEAAFNANTQQLMAGMLSRQQKGTKLVLANAVFLNKLKNAHVNDLYAKMMKTLYQAEVLEVKSAKEINKWAKQVTRGLITEAVPPNLQFKTVLANALYYLGAWSWPFDKTETNLAEFKNAKGKKVMVHMMSQTWHKYVGVLVKGEEPDRLVQFTEGSGDYRGVKLPYRGSNISAIALLPNPERFEPNQVNRALAKIDPTELFNQDIWQDSSSAYPSLQLKLPRFTVVVNQLSLKEPLQEIGVTEMFKAPTGIADRGDFGRLSDDPLFVSDVLHSTVVKVNEEGTEAAAVTTVPLAGASPGPHPKKTPPFVFDQPFVFIIVDEGDRPGQPWTPLFIGTVKEPTIAGIPSSSVAADTAAAPEASLLDTPSETGDAQSLD